MITPDGIEKILNALDKNIEINKKKKISIVVCGGSALFALDLIRRTTKDVDVLGLIDEERNKNSVLYMEKFPDWFKISAETVAKDFNLPEDWINLGPSAQVKSGLPSGLFERLTKKVYGKYLSVFYISRIDQIFFKLYASVDRGGYHVDDLLALDPTNEELFNACKWVLTQDVSEGFKLLLKNFLKKINYNEIAERI